MTWIGWRGGERLWEGVGERDEGWGRCSRVGGLVKAWGRAIMKGEGVEWG